MKCLSITVLAMILSIFAFGYFVARAFQVQAAEVTLAWDANSEPDLAGYRIFYHPVSGSYDYANPIWEGTETTCTVSVEADGYFVARAFDTSGLESTNSNEVFEGAITPPQNPKILIRKAITLGIQALEKLRDAIALSEGGSIE
jgi:hypothetical protein